MKYLVTLFCGHRIMAGTSSKRYCNKKCLGFHLVRKSQPKPPKREGKLKHSLRSNDSVWLEKGKRRVTMDGYIDLSFWSKELKMQCTRREHIVVWATFHQKELPTGWCIHHRDEDPANNHPDNLLAMTKGLHMELHRLLDQIARECEGRLYATRRNEVTDDYAAQVAEMVDRRRRWHPEHEGEQL